MYVVVNAGPGSVASIPYRRALAGEGAGTASVSGTKGFAESIDV
jgi:hypothetical protein